VIEEFQEEEEEEINNIYPVNIEEFAEVIICQEK